MLLVILYHLIKILFILHIHRFRHSVAWQVTMIIWEVVPVPELG